MAGNAVAEAAYFKRQLEDLKKVAEKATLWEEASKKADFYQEQTGRLFTMHFIAESKIISLNEQLASRDAAIAVRDAAIFARDSTIIARDMEIVRLRDYIARTVPPSIGGTPMQPTPEYYY